MANFNDYLKALKDPLGNFIKDNFSDFESEAKKDVSDFLLHAKDNISR